MERRLSLLTDHIEVLRAAVRRARAQHPFQNIPAAEGATLFRPTVMKMCRYLCHQGGGEVFCRLPADEHPNPSPRRRGFFSSNICVPYIDTADKPTLAPAP